MKDLQREKYLHLISEVEGLEERVDDIAKDIDNMAESGNPADVEITREELGNLKEKLIEKRTELARISDGCGHSRHEKDASWKASCTDGQKHN